MKTPKKTIQVCSVHNPYAMRTTKRDGHEKNDGLHNFIAHIQRQKQLPKNKQCKTCNRWLTYPSKRLKKIPVIYQKVKPGETAA